MPLNESGSNTTVQYTVSTTNTADGTVLYWKTSGNTTNSDIVGGNTGSITVAQPTVGTAPFEYSIDNGTTWQTSNVFSGLIAGIKIGQNNDPIE